MIYNLELSSILGLLMAYLDPGSGSILIQVIISALIGAGFFLRSRFGKLKKLFTKNSDETAEDGSIEDDVEDDLLNG